MLIKQDSSISRQDSQLSRQVFKKHYSSDSQFSRQDSNNSCQLLIKQDSNGSRNVLSTQDSIISYIEPREGSQLIADCVSQLGITTATEDIINEAMKNSKNTEPYPRRGILCKQDTQISYVENGSNGSSKNSLNDVTFVPHRRHQLIKQDSVMSFAGQFIATKDDFI